MIDKITIVRDSPSCNYVSKSRCIPDRYNNYSLVYLTESIIGCFAKE